MATAPDQLVDAYCCRGCRHVIFSSLSLVSSEEIHEKASTATVGTKHQKFARQCTSWFLSDPPKWMDRVFLPSSSASGETGEEEGVVEGENEGKLNCPKCNGRVGTFCWSGSTCSCGAWIVPAVQVPKSRIDVRKNIPLSVIQGFLDGTVTFPSATTSS